MATNISNDILWYVRDFQNIWLDNDYGQSSILSLNYEKLSNILSSMNLNVKNEYYVWKAIHDWVNFDKNNRLKYLPDLIENCLRFGRLDKHFIDAFIFECDLFMALSDPVQCGLKDFINTVLQNCKQTTVDSFNLLSPSYAIYSYPRNQLLLCIDRITGTIEFYNHQDNNWHSSSLSLKPHANQYVFELALLAGMLYAFGGQEGDMNTTNIMWSRDLRDPSSQWTTSANMKQRRYGFASVVLNDTIYVLGGIDKNLHSLRSCERYDSQLNQWSPLAEMNGDRYGASAAVIKDFIYIAGGWNETKKNLQSVSKYCPKTDTWSEVAPMTTARWQFALTSFGGRLWAIGGVGDDNQLLCSCESYDPVTDTWREEAPLQRVRRDHAAIEFNGELYVVGGWRNDVEAVTTEPTKIVEKYVPTVGWMEYSYTQKSYIKLGLLIIPHTYSSFFTTDTNQ